MQVFQEENRQWGNVQDVSVQIFLNCEQAMGPCEVSVSHTSLCLTVQAQAHLLMSDLFGSDLFGCTSPTNGIMRFSARHKDRSAAL